MIDLAKCHAVATATFVLVVILATFPGSSHGQTSTTGKELFQKRCGGCHAIDRDKEGPRLGGVNNRTAGSVESFQYSDALKNSKIVWNPELLDKWISNPDKLVPDNDMSFHLDNADERKEIIAYLQQTSAK